MNYLKASVTAIENIGNLNIVSFSSHHNTLKMMGLELETGIKVGTQVQLTFKATHVAIGKNISGDLSFSNQLQVSIHSIDRGELLCVLGLKLEDIYFESVITADSAKRMHLQKGDVVFALIKSSDLSIAEVL